MQSAGTSQLHTYLYLPGRSLVLDVVVVLEEEGQQEGQEEGQVHTFLTYTGL